MFCQNDIFKGYIKISIEQYYKCYKVAKKSGNLEKPWIWQCRLKPWKNLEFEIFLQKSLKESEIFNVFNNVSRKIFLLQK